MRHVAARGRRAARAAQLAGAGCAQAGPWNGELGGVIASRFSDGHLTELGIEARLKYAGEVGDAAAPWSLRMDGRLRTNSRACSRDPGPLGCDASEADADWRELYAQRQFGSWQASFGWQQVVWGRADNLRVLDLANPVDLRDFVLPDLGDYRRALPMVRLGHQMGDWHLDMVYVPWFSPNRTPGRGAEFYFREAEQFAEQGITLLPRRRPARTLGHGEIGMLLSRSQHQVDWSLMALSTYNDDPVYRFSARNLGSGAVPTAEPTFLRHTVLGASLAAQLAGGWVLRSEATWSPNTPYTALGAPEGLERARTVNALVGIDYAWRDWLFTAQAADRWISGWRSDYLAPERATVLTLSATGTSLGAKLSTRASVTWMPENGDGTWWQLRLTYRPDDHWSVEGSIDVLTGEPGGFFGQFRDRDRLRMALRRQF